MRHTSQNAVLFFGTSWRIVEIFATFSPEQLKLLDTFTSKGGQLSLKWVSHPASAKGDWRSLIIFSLFFTGILDFGDIFIEIQRMIRRAVHFRPELQYFGESLEGERRNISWHFYEMAVAWYSQRKDGSWSVLCRLTHSCNPQHSHTNFESMWRSQNRLLCVAFLDAFVQPHMSWSKRSRATKRAAELSLTRADSL